MKTMVALFFCLFFCALENDSALAGDDGSGLIINSIRISSLDVRMTFEDTSTASGPPANDWEITINDSDSATNGSNYFAVTDQTAGRQVFRIDAGAPELSLRVDADGNLNLASSTARIGNLADPVNDTDAVNLQTLNNTVANAASNSVPSWISSSNLDPDSNPDLSAANTSGTGSMAFGAGATAGTNDIAIGYHATVTMDNSTAVGSSSTIHSENSVAIGANSTIEPGAMGGTAVGQNTRVATGAENSVALGNNSIATDPNTVSVGSPGNERRITNISNGIHSGDAVNVRQLNTVSSKVDSNSKNIAGNSEIIHQNREGIAQNSREIKQLQDNMKDSYAGIAAAASMIVISPSAPGKTTFNVGAAHFKSESALGLTLAHRLDSDILGDEIYLNCGFSVANGENLTRIGGSWEF